jgi:hypothetical protein
LQDELKKLLYLSVVGVLPTLLLSRQYKTSATINKGNKTHIQRVEEKILGNIFAINEVPSTRNQPNVFRSEINPSEVTPIGEGEY